MTADELNRRCDACGNPFSMRERLQVWQAFAGRTWVGHRDHVEAEAAKWELIEKAELARLHDMESRYRDLLRLGVGGS